MEQVLFSLLQLSDTHLQAAGKRLKTGDSGAEALKQAIAKAYRTQAQFDAVILTGDLVDRGAVEEYRELEAGLRALPQGLPRYFCLGNHDAREAFTEVFGSLKGAGHSDALGTHYQYSAPLFTFKDQVVRLVVLDTLEPGKDQGRLCEQRRQWLHNTLSLYPNDRIVLVMHHLPFLTGSALFDSMVVEERRQLEEVLAGFKTVERIVCGHFHRACVTQLAGIPVVVSPSTVHAYPLSYRGRQHEALVIDEPAGFTIHRFIVDSQSAYWVSHFVQQSPA
jgi:3',5'-cyclic-AMP phosphodiesterase